MRCVLESGNRIESVFSRMLARAAADAREELHTSGRTCAQVARVGPPSFVILLRSMSLSKFLGKRRQEYQCTHNPNHRLLNNVASDPSRSPGL